MRTLSLCDPAFLGGIPFGTGGPAPSFQETADNYIARVEAADGQALETATTDAISDLFEALFAERTWRGNTITLWDKIGYCLPLCAPRTIAGAMEPLQDLTAATATSTGSMNWNRKTGLAVTSSTGTPRVDIPYADNADPQDDCSVHLKLTGATTTGTSGTLLNCNATGIRREIHRSGTTNDVIVSRSTVEDTVSTGTARTPGWRGMTRIDASEYTARVLGAESTRTRTSQGPGANNFRLFYRTNGVQYAGNNARLQGVEIGRDLDLAAYESVMDTFITAINSAF